MRARGMLIGAMLLGLASTFVPARPTPQENYLAIYLARPDSPEALEKKGDFPDALKGFQDSFVKLEKIQQTHPEWEPGLVSQRLEECRAKIVELQNKRRKTTSYPWKTDIMTSVFVLSQTSRPDSGWGQNSGSWPSWQGVEGVDARSKSRRSVSASPLLSPFYVALPFNDVAFPDLAQKWMPAGWYQAPAPGQKAASCCKDRWVEIKNAEGRLCFAQWEDVGPSRFDDAAYVFSPKRPARPDKPELDVSPAVAQYLGIDRHGAAPVSWRFVEDDDVRPGRWLKYDDLALSTRH